MIFNIDNIEEKDDVVYYLDINDNKIVRCGNLKRNGVTIAENIYLEFELLESNKCIKVTIEAFEHSDKDADSIKLSTVFRLDHRFWNYKLL